MPEPVMVRAKARFEYLGPLPSPACPAEGGTALQLLDTVDIWLAGTLQSLFNLIKR